MHGMHFCGTSVIASLLQSYFHNTGNQVSCPVAYLGFHIVASLSVYNDVE